jgi:heparanase 1
MRLIGPGNLGEETVDPAIAARMMAPGGAMSTKPLLEETTSHLDAISWHFYGGVSPRCGGGTGITSREAALTDAWLDRTLIEYDAIAGLKNKLAAGKPLWLTETAQAACGGSPWAAGFRDSFRYLNQLGVLAQRGVRVVMHNTLSASDYGLIDPQTLEPRPNYWAAILWRKTMGPVVLEPPKTGHASLRVFAHCLPTMKGGVGLLALNPGDAPRALKVGDSGTVWIMQADTLDGGPVKINGRQPVVDSTGAIGGLSSEAFEWEIALPPQSIAFASVDTAANRQCRIKAR